MKKGLVCVLAALMLITFTACDLFEKNYVVGVCQFDGCLALNNTTEGFRDALVKRLGERVTIQVENANGIDENCGVIADGFLKNKADLLLGCGAPALQAAASYGGAVPVLGAAVTDYPSALGLNDWNGTVGGNITGTSDQVPPEQQAAMIPEMFPQARTVGLLYCSQESDSRYQADALAGHLEALGLTGIPFPFTDGSDLSSVAKEACAQSDVIFLPTGACVSGNTNVIREVTVSAGVPVVAGNAELCQGCGTVAIAVDYYDLGYQAGLMAAQILTEEKSASSMPVVYDTETVKLFNAKNCAALGITIPEGYAPVE